ncbi:MULTISPECIES: response regulator [unclassified Butyrivibrio]|jgi:two-component system chemotaxis response regulator CheY|uniref:response regulator n=1 Tax=unclassified Butyrivibrio TaxID=2639466 RepID=UPI0003B3EC13|nr:MULTISPECIES: response regulator [unclassified Butyrivibrio]MBE5837686.1 response regulator [Butyrivibrio sp.]MBP3818079.1 response regulator [Butyrivibrio sp.]MBQ6414796.1 response regulator [Butyrivibrio sp.]MBQ9302667.1 response regulator [Butyrivibrio sp.]
MRKKILIADDTNLMREMLKAALDPEKYQIVGEALTGEQAVEYYKEKQPDLLILDINMPKMNGIDALTEVMKIDPKANVIMCSDQKYENMIVLALKKGAKDFVVKPFTSTDVVVAVRKVFGEEDA